MKRMMIDTNDPVMSIRRQCALLDLNRSTFYWQPATETPFNLMLMRTIDKEYTKSPSYGYRVMTDRLRIGYGYQVNKKRIGRLMRKMGLKSVAPRPNTSKRGKNHAIYPYLLRGVTVQRIDQVWSTDITYIPMHNGFMYLVAIMDWFSRFVLGWEISNTLEKHFCVSLLKRTLENGKPEIFNSDQGSQFTSNAFTTVLLDAQVQISMDGRGRCFDNIFIERLWRTVKYENIYLKEYQTVRDLYAGLADYFTFYNTERPHSSLAGYTPKAVYYDPEIRAKLRP